MSLSVCCQWLEPRTKRDGSIVYENCIDEKALQLGAFKSGKYSPERIKNTYHNNVDEHIRIFPELLKFNLKSFRLSSSLFPLYEFNTENIHSDVQLKTKLAKLGKLFIDAGIRVTTHPGQFCIINSDMEHVITNSVRELEYHAWIFDQMGFDKTPHYAINIHGGKRGNIDKLIESINKLPDNVRLRLTLENDERCFSVKQLIDISKATGVPIVFDSHHHVFNIDGLSMEQAAQAAFDTWKNCKPIQHLSNTEPGLENSSFTDRRKHSNFIHYIPDIQLELMKADLVDVDVEAKMKNLAVKKLRDDFNLIN